MSAKSFIEKLTGNKRILALSAAGLFIALIIVQDIIEANINHFSFYFSESVVFSSFWWLFIPFGYFQYMFANSSYRNMLTNGLLAVILPIVFHLISFPLLVLLLSFLFLDHTFVFSQTWNYTLSEHLHQVILLYTVPLAVFILYKSKEPSPPGEMNLPGIELEEKERVFIKTLTIADNNRHFNIAVSEVSFFTACAPYISVYHRSKKYLLTDTLKALPEKLPTSDFVRIHKSSIVNINHVTEFTSRLNGDYDTTMEDGTILRVSRNYARNFKERFNQCHHVTLK